MKPGTAIPKDILAITTEIRAKRAAIEQHRKDIDRAGEAAREAERLEGEIQALSDKRARIKAEAFIAGTKADIAELDKQEEQLEKASRRAREDGKAGALAVQLLEEKIAEHQAEITRLEEGRTAKTVEWLTARREAAIDQWNAALNALGPIVAEALAAEAARRRFVPNPHYREDPLAGAQAIVFGLPMRRGSWVSLSSGDSRWTPEPLDWGHDQKPGKREHDQLISELTDAGVL